MDQNARKKVRLTERTYNRLRQEKERPTTPTLIEAQHTISARLDGTFQNFWEVNVYLCTFVYRVCIIIFMHTCHFFEVLRHIFVRRGIGSLCTFPFKKMKTSLCL